MTPTVRCGCCLAGQVPVTHVTHRCPYCWRFCRGGSPCRRTLSVLAAARLYMLALRSRRMLVPDAGGRLWRQDELFFLLQPRLAAHLGKLAQHQGHGPLRAHASLR